MIEKEIKITVDASGAEESLKNLDDSIKQVGDSSDEVGKKYSGNIKKSSLVVDELDKKTNGLASSLLDVGDAAKKTGKTISKALISSGITAIIALLGLVIANWDEIRDAIDSTNARLRDQIDILKRKNEVLDQDLRILKLQQKNLEKQGFAIEDIIELQLENLKTQLINNKALIKNLEIQQKIELSKNREVSLLERAKIFIAESVNPAAAALEKAKAQVAENERTLELQKDIKDLNAQQLILEGEILDIINAKGAANRKYLKELKQEEEKILKEINRLQNEALNNELSNRDKEIQAAKNKYNRVIEAAKKFNIDTGILEEERRQIIESINLKYDNEEIQRLIDKENRKEEILDSYFLKGLEKEIADIERQTDNDVLELERLGAKREEIERIISESEDRINSLVSDASQKRADEEAKISKDKTDNQIQYEENLKDASVQLAGQTLDIVAGLAEEGSELAKGVAVAQAIISTYQGINAALAQTTDPTPFQVLRFANAAAVGIAGLLNVQKILDTQPIETSAPSASAGQVPPAPNFNLVEGTAENQISDSIQSQDEPVRAYVVSGDITTAQQADRNIIESSSI